MRRNTSPPSSRWLAQNQSDAEDLVQAVVEKLDPTRGVEPVFVTDETEYFPPPRELRDLLPALEALASLSVGGSPGSPAGSLSADRTADASRALADLGG